MGYYEFPHTRNYDTDLGYLIKRYFELNQSFTTVEQSFQDLKAWCLSQLNSEALKTLVANKLDEWLQDGTLEALINNPLNHVTTYDTVVEMLTHSALLEGTKVYCTGADTVNDSKGGHFRIRARLSTDVIDNYNLYLIDGNLKVAERITNTDTSSVIGDDLLFGISWNDNTEAQGTFPAYPYIITNLENGEAVRISDTPLFDARDNDTVNINGLWYNLSIIQGTNKIIIRTSNDLVNWTEHITSIDIGTYDNLWAVDFFVDSNKIYLLSIAQVSISPFTSRMLICEINLNTYLTSNVRFYDLDGSTYIDPSILKYNGIYYLVIKCEVSDDRHTASTIQLFSSPSIDNAAWTYLRTLPFDPPVEAPMLIRYHDKFVCFVDSHTNKYTSGMMYSFSDDLITWSSLNSIICFNNGDKHIRHCCFRIADNNSAITSLLSKATGYITNNLPSTNTRIGNELLLNNYKSKKVKLNLNQSSITKDRLSEDETLTMNLFNFDKNTYTLPMPCVLSGVYDSFTNGIFTKKSTYINITASSGLRLYQTVGPTNIFIQGGTGGATYDGNKCSWSELSAAASWTQEVNKFCCGDNGELFINLPAATYPDVNSVLSRITSEPLRFALVLKTPIETSYPYELLGNSGHCSIIPSNTELSFYYSIDNELKTAIQNL